MARDRADRAKCGHCGSEYAVKQDGTLYKHTAYVNYEHHECKGSGKRPKNTRLVDDGYCFYCDQTFGKAHLPTCTLAFVGRT